MEIRNLKARLEGSKQFKQWKAKHRDAFFYLVFSMFGDKGEPEFELSYYSPLKREATIFLCGEEPSLKDTDKLFGDKAPQRLSLTNVKIDFEKAMEKGRQFQEERYSGESPLKNIVMLQMIKGKPTWNITFFTVGFSTLNIRIDAEKGRVIDHSLRKLFDFVK